jgi:RHS repeat-associated protein
VIAIVQRTGLKSASNSLGRDTVTITTRPNSSGVATRTTIHTDGTKTVETLTHGLLVEKNHPGETDNGTTDADYTYTNGGRLYTRTWERGITSTYGYTHGLLTSTNYSDSTPDVAITYDSLGRQSIVTQANQSRIETTYDTATLQADLEIVSYDLDHNGTWDFTRTLDRKPTSLGRDTGWQLKIGGTIENEALYTWSATTGRLETVANAADTFSYDYEDDSYGLLATVTKEASGGNPVLVATRAYETTRDVLASIQNNAGTTVRSSCNYSVVNGGVNSIGQRKGVRTTFTLGGLLDANPGDTSWGYDSLGQVTSASAPGTNADRAYQFDTIGNRLFSEISNTQISDPPTANTTGYTANALNQYAAVNTFVPTHDADGNQIDSQIRPLGSSSLESCVYTWDAENRLKEVRAADDTTVIASYLYDAQSRRIAKIVGGITTLYVYDGFNCIAEYSWSADLQSASLSKTRTWGMDLSGNLQGAGGVGGLLAEKQGANSFYPTFDGNGNISEYLAANGSTAAHFEYDPFGNTVVNTDSSGQFSYRFSTKPLDSETGLYYYQYRYLDPLTGRWPSRDPIGEWGGLNLYGFVGNDAVTGFDVLGLSEAKCECPEDIGNLKGLKIKGSITMGGGSEFDFYDPKGLADDLFNLHLEGGKIKGAEEFARMFAKAAKSFGNLTQSMSIINNIREIQAGLIVEEFDVEATMDCCADDGNGGAAWTEISDSGNTTIGSSLTTDAGRTSVTSGMMDAIKNAANGIKSKCPK